MANHKSTTEKQRMRSFGPIWIRISDPRSLGLKCIKVADESTLDLSVPLMHNDLKKNCQWRKASENRSEYQVQTSELENSEDV